MANVFIEARPKGRPDGSPIDDYVVEDGGGHVLATTKTQQEAIDWAKKNKHHPLVAHVRHLNEKKVTRPLAIGRLIDQSGTRAGRQRC